MGALYHRRGNRSPTSGWGSLILACALAATGVLALIFGGPNWKADSHGPDGLINASTARYKGLRLTPLCARRDAQYVRARFALSYRPGALPWVLNLASPVYVTFYDAAGAWINDEEAPGLLRDPSGPNGSVNSVCVAMPPRARFLSISVFTPELTTKPLMISPEKRKRRGHRLKGAF